MFWLPFLLQILFVKFSGETAVCCLQGKTAVELLGKDNVWFNDKRTGCSTGEKNKTNKITTYVPHGY